MMLDGLYMVETINAVQMQEIFANIESYWEDQEANDSCDENDHDDDDVDHPKYSKDAYGYVEAASELSDLDSSIRSLSFPEVSNDISVTDLIGQVPIGVETLYLGHDGVIYINNTKGDDGYNIGSKPNSEEAITAFRALIAGLPNLNKIHHCGYYSQYSSTDIKKAAALLNRSVKVCKIY